MKEKFQDAVILSSKMLAFVLFKEEGLPAMGKMYPEHVDFVREHEAKTITEVKYMLFGKPKLLKE